MSGDSDLLDTLVYSVYRTIHEPERWALILRELQQALGADACDLSTYDFRARRGEITLHSGCYDQKYLHLYQSGYATLNPWLIRQNCYCEDGTCWFGRQIVPHAQLVDTKFFSDWLAPQGLFHRLSATVVREDHRVVYVSVLRAQTAGPFGPEHQRPLQRLVPHLRQILELHSLLSGPAALGPAPLSEVAGRLARVRDVLKVNRELDRLDPLPDPASRVPGGEWPRAPGKDALGWWPNITPVADNRIASMSEPAAGADGNADRLARLYRLTAAEARLAVLLASGMTLSKAASVLDISMATVRTHLQRIFGKTYTHHQAQLVALLLLGPAEVKVEYRPPDDDLRKFG